MYYNLKWMISKQRPVWWSATMKARRHWTVSGLSALCACSCLPLICPIRSLRTAYVSPRSSPLTDVSRGETSATQWQKFHTDDVNQCLNNKFGIHGVPNANLFNFTFLLVDFGKVLFLSSNELQQNSNASLREDYIPQILAVLLEIHRVYIWPLRPFVFVCHS